MTAPAKQPDGRETRAVTADLEFRSAEGTARTATGYAALFGNRTTIGSYWSEEIRAGAFAKSLASNDVIAIIGHDTGRVVGRTGAGTLRLREDDRGLAFENDLPDTTDGRDLAVLLERKDIPGMSFGFITRKQEWDETIDPPHRTIIEAEIYEITYTPCPAYPDTEVGLRDLEHARAERRDHNRAGAASRMAARRARQAHAERGV